MSTPVQHEAAPRLPVSLLAGALLAASLAPLGSTMVAVALPIIGEDIGAEPSVLTTWLVSSYLITSIALQSPGGKLGDLIGHARALVVGLSLVALGGILGMLGGEVHTLGAARILMAAGGGATVPATMALLRNQTMPARRARWFGFFGACMGLAAAIGPMVGGELTERFGWRAVFGISLPVAGASFLLLILSRSLRVRPAHHEASFDWTGSALLGFGFTLVIVALQMMNANGWWLGGIGSLLLIAYPFWERRSEAPAVDISLFKHAAFVGGSSIIALQNMAMYPLMFQLPVFFDRARHLGPRTMGQALLALTAGMVLASVAGGRMTEVIGARVQTLLGSVLALTGLWWFVDLASVHKPSEVLLGMLLIGAGVGITTPPAQAASLGTVDQRQSGMAAGVVWSMRYLGGVAGTTALGALLTDAASPASHQRPIFVYAGALVTAAALSLTLPGRHHHKT